MANNAFAITSTRRGGVRLLMCLEMTKRLNARSVTREQTFRP